MKKLYNTVIFVCILSYAVSGQVTFTYVSEIPDKDQVITDGIELPNHNFIFTGCSGVSPLTQSGVGKILKLSKRGLLVSETDFQWNGNVTWLEKVLPIKNDTFAIIGNVRNGSHLSLYLGLIDSTLSILKSREFPIKNFSIFTSQAILDHYGNIVVHGLIDSLDITFQYIYKISINLDSIKFKIFKENQSYIIPCLIEKEDTSGYIFTFPPGFVDNSTGPKILDLNYNLFTEDIKQVHDNITGFNNISYLNDSIYILSGIYSNLATTKQDMGILFLDPNLNTIKANIQGNSQVNTNPAFRRNLIRSSEETIYYGGTSNIVPWNPYFANVESWFKLIKYDNLLNLKWEKQYGKINHYLNMWGITNTEDGGCVMYGSMFDFNLNVTKRDIYIIKVDADGNTISGDDEQISIKSVINISPNPGSDKIYLESLNFISYLFYLFDLEGKVILKKNIINSGVIDVSTLSKGIYFYKIIFENNIVRTGKWVKI